MNGGTLKGYGKTGLAWLVLVIVLMLPAMVNGGVIFMDDLGPYARGGRQVALRLLAMLPDLGAASGSNAEGEGASGGPAYTGAVSGARSILFSAYTYLTGVAAPRFLGTVAVSAGLLAALFLMARRAFSLKLWQLVAICLLTSVGWVASYGGPDVWAAIIVLAWGLFAFRRADFDWFGQAFLLALITAGVAFHASHVLLGAGLIGWTALTLGWRWWRQGYRPRPLALAPTAAVIAGIALTALSGLIAFGEPSAAPKRYPIVLARAIHDGPAHWYLTDVCPEAGYTVCEVYGNEIPDNVGDFLWSEVGVSNVATPDQLQRMRQEETEIISAAMKAYPFFQIRQTANNIWLQFVRFAITSYPVGYTADYVGEGVTEQVKTGRNTFPTGAVDVLLDLVLIVSGVLIVGFVVIGPQTLPRREMWAVVLGLIAVLGGNAIICGGLSAPVDRYQARLIWLLPLVAVILAGPRPQRPLMLLARRARRTFRPGTRAS